MKKESMFLILTLFVISSFSLLYDYVFAQEFQSDDIQLFVPQKMIAGESYQGMVTLLNPLPADSLILLSSDDDYTLESDVSVIVPANQNHGIFDITPKNEGQAEIFASFNGEITSTITTIYSKKSGPQKLQVILPGNYTIADKITGYVFLLDGNGFPVSTNFDRVISLISSEKIIVPNKITIFNGTTNASFEGIVRATGEITATGISLVSGSSIINKAQQTVNVHIAIAPNIALQDSYVNYFVWLENNGKPYNVSRVIPIEISSSNIDVVRLGVSPSSYKNVNSIILSMHDGMATGRLYTGENGSAEIFVSVPNYGHSSTIISVGPVILSDGVIIEEEISSGKINLEPNNIQFWVYPGITDDLAYGVAALYHSISTEILDVTLNEDGTQITHLVEHTTLIPVKTEDALISISSESGIQHNSGYLLDDVSFPTHSKIFEIITENTGDYTITATGGKDFDTADLTVTTPYNSYYSIQTVPLPISPYNTQPLMLVSIIDENQNIIDVSDIFGYSLIIHVDSINGIIGSSKLNLIDNTGVISGIINNPSTINLSSDKFGTHSKQVTPSGIPVSVEFEIPYMVHTGEAFPITIHEVDSGGIPIFKKQSDIVTSSGFEKIDDGIILVDESGEQQLSILGKIGGAFQGYVDSFTNTMTFDVISDTIQARVGTPVIIEIDSPLNNIEYSIDSPFPYEKIDDTTFSITPDHTIVDGTITITGKLDGFSTLSKQISLSSENIVEISTNAITIHGKIISPTYDIHLGNGIESTIAPEKHLIKPQQIILEFPENYSTISGGYRLIDLKLDDVTTDGNIVDFYAGSDHTITAIYDRFVQITVNNGEGSGIYPYDTMIKISAPDKPKLSFLIVEKFDYWEEVDKPSSFTVDGQEDVTVTAIYKDDYTGLMAVIFISVIAVVFIILKKTSQKDDGSGGIAYYVSDYVEKIIALAKQIIPVNKITSKSKNTKDEKK